MQPAGVLQDSEPCDDGGPVAAVPTPLAVQGHGHEEFEIEIQWPEPLGDHEYQEYQRLVGCEAIDLAQLVGDLAADEPLEAGDPPHAFCGQELAPHAIGGQELQLASIPNKEVGLPKGHKRKGISQIGYRSWLRLDPQGESSIVRGDKLKLTTKLGIQARDMRFLQGQGLGSPPGILCRERAIVVRLEHIKAIITRSCVLFLNPEDDQALDFIMAFKQHLSTSGVATGYSSNPNLLAPGLLVSHGHDSDLPFELRALEVCLESAVNYYNTMVLDLEKAGHHALESMTLKVSPANLDSVRKAKSKLVRLSTRITTLREILEKYLNDDQAMHDMNLTAKEQDRLNQLKRISLQPAREREGRSEVARSWSSSDSEEDEQQIAEVEMIITTYFLFLSQACNRLQALSENIDDAEGTVKITLGQQRNTYLIIGLLLNAFNTFVAPITAITSVMAMMTYESANIFSLSTTLFVPLSVGQCVVCMMMFGGFVMYLWGVGLLVT